MNPLALWAGIGDFFSAIMEPLRTAVSFVLGYAYRFWSVVTGPDSGVTWVLAIVTLTILVRTLLIPLFVKQINSSRNMQAIQPKMKELQDKYGADREKLGIETQKLMKEEGVNPASSCLPLLIQMPIFFALYQVLAAAGQGVGRGWYLAHNPELAESLHQASIFGAKLAGNFLAGPAWWPLSQWEPTRWLSLVLIILMSSLFFIMQRQLMTKNMPPAALEGPMAQQQKMMLYAFPALYLFMGVIIQVGVLLYWVTSNLWTLVQQWILIHNNPTPGTPAYIDWEERMISKGKDPDAIAKARQAKRSRRPTEAKTTTGRSGVQRQSVQPPAGGAGGPQRQTIARSQPKKQSRAQRKANK
ncbi:MAG: membrane protein insertase YidC [Propionibacteriaceae bacterium]|jgi:YidC/Oxa1 family membrane protein insertase|nr:membrane protein insertase YidC [Propionibacteriaceae bacterium]